ncbi:MAG: aldehyde dehydrogenase family protein [Actinomycetota bacterium]|nr:aldehyde dehydrogenase family protein [Actinomycetota bacterium]
MSTAHRRLTGLQAGQVIVYGGDRTTTVAAALADAFCAGDRLIVVDRTGDMLHVPAAAHEAATSAIDAAIDAFGALSRCTDDQISTFFASFADRLADDDQAAPILAANAEDVDRARAAGRSTTRLTMSATMRVDMIAGLRLWAKTTADRDATERVLDHQSWSMEARRAPLGVVGFVFEGRPNVFADAAGVVRTGNTAVLRIGSDALATARAIVNHALAPALAEAGLPAGAVALLDDPSRASGWAMFADGRLSLAVARGSGRAVAQLGAVGRQSGVAVSLHGTGGAWLVAGEAAHGERFGASVLHSLDRKVCNTLNVCAIPSSRPELVPVFLDALDGAADRRGMSARLHADDAAMSQLPPERAGVEPLDRADLSVEWEWEDDPEVSLVVVDDVAEAIDLHNRYSPRFVASMISDDDDEVERFYAAVDAPFVGDGFTRWVDGQYALGTPELGLSNWQSGRLLARGGVLSGDSVYTVRYMARIHDPELSR